MEAKEYLEQIRIIDKDIDSRIAEKESLIQTIVKSPTLSDINVQESNRLHYDDKYTKIIQLSEEIDDLIDTLAKIKKEATALIDKVGEVDKEAMIILRYRYLSSKSWEVIADKMCYGLRHVYKVHGNALNEFRKVYKDGTKWH